MKRQADQSPAYIFGYRAISFSVAELPAHRRKVKWQVMECAADSSRTEEPDELIATALVRKKNIEQMSRVLAVSRNLRQLDIKVTGL
jgi:hypothetical protein